MSCILVTNNENGIADDCYRRIQRIRNGYNNTKGEWVDGLPENNILYERCSLEESDGE